MRSRYDNAPVGNTCPDIDSIINTLSGIADRLDEIANRLDCDEVDDLNAQAANLRTIFDGRRSPLEELRSANESLRKWGNAECERADDAEAECHKLRDEISDLEAR